MSIFDTWDEVDCGNPKSTANNTVRFQAYKKKLMDGEKDYRRLMLSRDLVVESGAERFTLKTKGDVYALVPNENGTLYHRDGRILGIASVAINRMVDKLGGDVFKASVIDGAIVFPIKNDFIMG